MLGYVVAVGVYLFVLEGEIEVPRFRMNVGCIFACSSSSKLCNCATCQTTCYDVLVQQVVSVEYVKLLLLKVLSVAYQSSFISDSLKDFCAHIKVCLSRLVIKLSVEILL